MHKTLYLIRHAESLGNAGFPDAGPNPGLSPLGHRQAGALAAEVASEGPVAAIWSSPFKRAVETACLVAQAVDARVRLEPGMHELFFAGWFDMSSLQLPSLAAVAHTHPRIDFDEDDAHWWPTVPEDADALRDRLSLVAQRLMREAQPGRILAVGHGASVAALAHALVPEFDPLIAVVENASITEVECQRDLCRLVRFNDTRDCV